MITAALSAFVYIDVLYLFSIFFITIPAAVLSAVIAIIISYKEKQKLFIFLNALFAFIAIISFVLIPW